MKKSRMTIYANEILSHINSEIYGQFSEHLGRCVYEGMYVGVNSHIDNINGIRIDVINALREIDTPVLRWPGGCFADEYHWMDGIGPLDERRKMINTNWGGVVEDNSFGTHEFMELCRMIGCEPYIAINVGSGTVREAAEWIEYMTANGESTMAFLREKNGQKEPWKLKYVGIGNENWGCGGNMNALYYANEYKRYQTFCKNYSENELYKIACGPNADDTLWTETLMQNINGANANAISLHYYTLPNNDWNNKGSATDFTDEEYYNTIKNALKIEDIINAQLSVMNKYDENHDIDLVVDEWGNWYDSEPGTNPGFLYQQNTMRDAITASINLNIFNKHSDRIKMANIAQAVNVLQALVLTEGEQIIKTPTFEVFKMYKGHHEGELVKSQLEKLECGCGDVVVPELSESVSIKENLLTITISNASLTEAVALEIILEGKKFNGEVNIITLQGDAHDHNTFKNKDKVKTVSEKEIWKNSTGNITIPPCTVITVECHVR